MEVTLPVKRLNRLSWLLSVVIGIIFYFVILHNDSPKHVYGYTLLTMLGILLVGYADVGAMMILAARIPPRSKKFRRYRGFVTYPVSILIYLLLWPVFSWLGNKSWTPGDISLILAFTGSGVVINSMIIIMHNSVLLYEHNLQSELELSQLKTAHAEAANLLLKQQIHPHFLFNALNTLKALYRKDPNAGDTYIVHLANFLRASVYNHAAKISTLGDEIALLTDYLEMQKIRFGTALYCTIDLPEAMLTDRYLPYFSLQPLLENALKHNDLTTQSPLLVHISCDNDWVTVSNNLQKKSMKLPSTNHGLANLAERYRLWSGDEIIIKEYNETFSVSIKLLSHEYSDHRG